MGSQPFRQHRSHRCDHTCACSATDDSSEYVSLDLMLFSVADLLKEFANTCSMIVGLWPREFEVTSHHDHDVLWADSCSLLTPIPIGEACPIKKYSTTISD